MSALINKARCFVQPSSVIVNSRRFRGKINIQKPRTPHYEKARVLKLTEPYFPSKKSQLSLIELCGNIKPKVDRTTVENPFQKILAKECLNWFNHSRLVALFHMNPMSADENFNAFVAFKKSNIHMKIYGLRTLKMALEGTKFETFAHNYVCHNVILFSPEPDIKKMLKICKKFPQIILLAGIFEGKFVSKDDLLYYSQITDIQVARASLVQTLEGVGSQLAQRLCQQQNTLANRLQDRAEQLKEPS